MLSFECINVSKSRKYIIVFLYFNQIYVKHIQPVLTKINISTGNACNVKDWTHTNHFNIWWRVSKVITGQQCQWHSSSMNRILTTSIPLGQWLAALLLHINRVDNITVINHNSTYQSSRSFGMHHSFRTDSTHVELPLDHLISNIVASVLKRIQSLWLLK